jgi:DNA helicase-2/ATP-dependent DNA helicase PcrA
MDRLYLLHARARSLWGSGQYNLPSRFLDEIPERLVERQVVGAPSGGWGTGNGGGWGGGWGGRGRRGARDWDERPESDDDHASLGSGRRYSAAKPEALDAEVVEQYFAAGERVLHATLGEGTVLAVESGGIVLVRFENDGSERRLMASVAPLRRLRG